MHVMQAATGTGQLHYCNCNCYSHLFLQATCRQLSGRHDYQGCDIVAIGNGEGAWISNPQWPPSDQKAQGQKLRSHWIACKQLSFLQRDWKGLPAVTVERPLQPSVAASDPSRFVRNPTTRPAKAGKSFTMLASRTAKRLSRVCHRPAAPGSLT